MKKNKKKAISQQSSTIIGPEKSNSDWNELALLVAIVAAVTILTYIPSLLNGFISNWDDNRYITENIHIRSLGINFFKWALFDYKTNLWHPISWISHAIDYAVWGLKPFGHHLTNVVLHAVNTGIVVILSHELLKRIKTPANDTTSHEKSPDRRSLILASGMTGLLFGIHPLHVESVAWVTERKDLLYSLFFMLSLIAYIRYASDNGTGKPTACLANRHYLLSLGLFIFSLGSKPMAITLPVVCLLLDWYPLRRMTREKWLSLGTEKIPFFALSIFVSLLTIHAQKEIGALVSITEAPPFFRIMLACKSLMLYLLKSLIPYRLLPLYPYPEDANPFKPEYLIALLLVLAITTTCLILKKTRPFLLVVWLFFIINLLPILGIMQAGIQSMADRFAYLASLGPLLLTSTVASSFWQKAQTSKMARRASLTAAALVLTLLVSMTLRQISIWKDAVTLWGYMLANYSPTYAELYHYRGQAYQKAGLLDAAIGDYSKCIDLAPKHVEAHVNRGTALVEKGELDKAIEDFDRAIALNPKDILVYACRGNAYAKKGMLSKAKEDFTRAISIKPINAAYINRGLIHMDEKEYAKAAEDFSAAIALQPDYADAYTVRGDAHMKMGRSDLASEDYKQACSMGIQAACEKNELPMQKNQ